MESSDFTYLIFSPFARPNQAIRVKWKKYGGREKEMMALNCELKRYLCILKTKGTNGIEGTNGTEGTNAFAKHQSPVIFEWGIWVLHIP